MGVADKGAGRADEKLHEVLDPLLTAGETMVGRLMATRSATESKPSSSSSTRRATRHPDATDGLAG